MQVNPALPAGPNPPAGSTRETLQSDVVQLLTPSPQARLQHEQAVERREEKLRRRDSAQQEVAAQAAAAPRPSEQIFKAERDLAPGSHAAREQQLHEQVQGPPAHPPSGFKQVLAEATGRSAPEPPPPTAPPSAPPTPTEAPAAPSDKPAGSTEPSTPPSTSPPAPPAGATAPNSAPAADARPSSPATTAAPSPMRVGMVPAISPGSIRVTVIASPVAAGRIVAAPRPSAASPVTPPVSRTGPVGVKNSLRQPTPTEPESRNADANVERILRFIQARLGKERSSATLRLEPPELGTVRLRMELRDQQLSLDVQTRTTAARQLLTEQVETLRRSLEATGIHLERVDIRGPAHTDVPNNNSPQTSPWTGPQGGNGRQDGGPASGGLPGQPGPPGTEADLQPEEPAFWEPVAESLVNVLA